MSKLIAVKRYAEALFHLGREKDLLDQYEAELKIVRDVFIENPSLDKIFRNPNISSTKKKQFVDEIFHAFHIDIVNTLKILIERKRTEIITSLYDRFTELVNEAKGIAQAKVFSVRKLTKTEKESLQKQLAERLNKSSVQVQNMIDPSLIGGLKIQVGHTLYDGSVKNKLKRIEQKIIAASNR